tara:strand:- start:53190 stop:53348 length:159 start_codon:yes stop_codon:yes gene_type:complete
MKQTLITLWNKHKKTLKDAGFIMILAWGIGFWFGLGFTTAQGPLDVMLEIES